MVAASRRRVRSGPWTSTPPRPGRDLDAPCRSHATRSSPRRRSTERARRRCARRRRSGGGSRARPYGRRTHSLRAATPREEFEQPEADLLYRISPPRVRCRRRETRTVVRTLRGSGSVPSARCSRAHSWADDDSHDPGRVQRQCRAARSQKCQEKRPADSLDVRSRTAACASSYKLMRQHRGPRTWDRGLFEA